MIQSPDAVSLKLTRTFPESRVANLIEHVYRGEVKARAELADHVRNKFGPDEGLSVVCALANGTYKFHRSARYTRRKEKTASKRSEIANYVFEQKQAGVRDPIKRAMREFKKTRRAIKDATKNYAIEDALRANAGEGATPQDGILIPKGSRLRD
jgi:hypothetical protein